MKKAEKHLRSQRKILDCAVKEFSEKGYLLGSVNNICAEGGISKGNLYHYYSGEDELYLLCVKECFDRLTDYLEKHVSLDAGTEKIDSSVYFNQRKTFFQKYPLYKHIFSEVLVNPPEHLRSELAQIRVGYDDFDRKVFDYYLEWVKVRPDINKKQLLDIMRQFQNFMGALYAKDNIDDDHIDKYYQRVAKVIFYGLVDRG